MQGEIVKAAERFLGVEVQVDGAGRTDSGVHALQQVGRLRFKSGSRPPSAKELHFGINGHLPHDVNILRIKTAEASFHPRHDATARFYLYQIATRRTAFGKSLVWWVKDKLDSDEMSFAIQSNIGMHDFRSFAETSTKGSSTLVHVHTAEIAAVGGLILIRIGASHFLWKMVRRIVGVVVEVGRGRMKSSQFSEMLNSQSNEAAALTAPPSGLFLEKVLYQGDSTPDELRAAFPIS